MVCGRDFFFSSRRRHTRSKRDWSSDVCSSDLFNSKICPLQDAGDARDGQSWEALQKQIDGEGPTFLERKSVVKDNRSASLQRTFKKSFTSFSHSTRNKTRDGLIRVRKIRALNGRFTTSITHAYSIVIGSKHITLNATGGGFLTASKQFRHGSTSKSRSNTASNSTKHKSPRLSGWRQIISLIT